MKRHLLLMAALAVIGTLWVAPLVSAQDETAEQGDPAEAMEAAKLWRAETDAVKKTQFGVDIVTRFAGTKVAEYVAGTTYASGTVDQKLAIALAYYKAYKAAAKQGQYVEYSLAVLATTEPDPYKKYEYCKMYLSEYAQGKWAPNVSVRKARHDAFTADLKGGANVPRALELANEAFAAKQDEYFFLRDLAKFGGGDVEIKGSGSPYLRQVLDWTARTLEYLESAAAPAGSGFDQGKWDAERSSLSFLMNRWKGRAAYILAVGSKPVSANDLNNALDALNKAIAVRPKDAVTYYYLADVYTTIYGIQYDIVQAMTPEQKATPEGEAKLKELDATIDKRLDNYIRAMAFAGPNEVLKNLVKGPLNDLYKFRHPDAPDGAWMAEVQKIAGS